jgi:glycosyltransferase involved in cell wall biosynthesis
MSTPPVAAPRPTALWVTAIPPSFDGGGGHIRQAHLLRALCARFDVHLVVAGGRPPTEVTDMVTGVSLIDAVPSDPDESFIGRSLDAARSVSARRHSEVALLRDVRREMGPVLDRLGPVDLVQVEFVSLWPLVRHRRSGHWAITLHNLGSGMSAHRAALAGRRRSRFIHQRKAANAERVEARVVASYDTTIVVSDEDAAPFGGAPLVVPNGVDLDRFVASAPAPEPRVVFTGALYTDPNVDAVRWLVEEIWPLVRRERSDAELDVVGMAPTPEVRRLCEAPGVALHADVDSTQPFLEAARLAVVPVRVGTGSRLKALEAMAAGRPVVGTTIGLGGLAVVPGRDVLVADDAAAFAAEIHRLLEPGPEASALGRRGRALVEAEYSWQQLGRRYVESIEARLGSSGRA